jgi:hypothetical protein
MKRGPASPHQLLTIKQQPWRMKMIRRFFATLALLLLLMFSASCFERFQKKEASDPHAGETAEEHAAHSEGGHEEHGEGHEGETEEEHAAHSEGEGHAEHGEGHEGETEEEHAGHSEDAGHEGHDHSEGGDEHAEGEDKEGEGK